MLALNTMENIDLRWWVLMDNNKTYTDNNYPYEKTAWGTEPISQKDLDLLRKDLEEIEPWKYVRPYLDLQNSNNYHHSLAWERIGRKLNFRQETYKEIASYYVDYEVVNMKWWNYKEWENHPLVHKSKFITPYKVKTREYYGFRDLIPKGELTIVTSLLEHNYCDLIKHYDNRENHDEPIKDAEPTTLQLLKKVSIPLWMGNNHDVKLEHITFRRALTYKIMLEYIDSLNKQNEADGSKIRYKLYGVDDDLWSVFEVLSEFNGRYEFKMGMPQSYESIEVQVERQNFNKEFYEDRFKIPLKEMFLGQKPLVTCGFKLSNIN